MDFQYTEEQIMIRDMARKFSEKEIRPVIDKYDREGEFPEEICNKMIENGLMSIACPAEYGGPGIDLIGQALAVEEIAWGDAGIATTMVANCMLAADPITIAANPEQAERWWGRVLEGKYSAFCLTEAGSGSDAAGMSMTCKKDGDGYLLNGVKQFITNGPIADQFTVFATLGKELGHKGICCFMVEKERGVQVGKHEDKLGIRTSYTSEVIFDNVWVPKENMLGPEGSGFITCMKTLDLSRPMVAAMAVGVANAAFEYALEYTQQRKQFGKPLSSFQAIQFKLAEMAMNIEAGRLLIHKALATRMAGLPYSQLASIAKLFCGDMVMKTTVEAVQCLGGYGFVKDYPVEKWMRDAKIYQIYEGTSEIQHVVIANNLLRGLR